MLTRFCFFVSAESALTVAIELECRIKIGTDLTVDTSFLTCEPEMGMPTIDSKVFVWIPEHFSLVELIERLRLAIHLYSLFPRPFGIIGIWNVGFRKPEAVVKAVNAAHFGSDLVLSPPMVTLANT